MSFTHKEPLQPKLAAMPASKDVEALVRAEHHDPFSILGPHDDGHGGQFIRAFLPQALSVHVLARDSGEPLGHLQASQVPGLFVGHFDTRQGYLLKIQWTGGEQITEDPYSFSQLLLGEMDLYLFAEGNHRDLSSCLGAQVTSVDGVEGVRFAVWAPNARRVSVVGDFNIWDGRRHPMRLRHPSGVWEIFIPRLQAGAAYKYEILGAHGILPLKADPMALATQLPPDTASKVAVPLQVDWQDHQWMQARVERQKTSAPLSIYELHVGSWQCELDEAGEVSRQYGWRELAERLIPYVQQLGFTHIELMPIMEHPVWRLLGLSSVVAVCAECAFWFAAGFRLVRQRLPPGRYRCDSRLGAGAFSDRYPRPGAIRRHCAVRIRQPAGRFSPGLGHADLQPGPHRSAWLHAGVGSALAQAFPCRRPAGRCGGLDAVPRLLAQGRRMGAEPPWRAGEPGGHRLPASLERRGRP